ncbi:hypothetical protein TC41_2154 [Alicyclobacillus acidocaldarius subsp. acidocaldarius Tc-4-1]|uniref:Uncharacterized protein n=1 Tax=Alicyclobacillus acidocaldarius (strain Tc-4-1) TaxID=1048834 RepID=F8IF95_ALIAT|nr:hypothetical protein TC41_2154 [Alicyclobacillus acidocaldarius subsp. acidocaldarius Tc-4-1]
MKRVAAHAVQMGHERGDHDVSHPPADHTINAEFAMNSSMGARVHRSMGM